MERSGSTHDGKRKRARATTGLKIRAQVAKDAAFMSGAFLRTGVKKTEEELLRRLREAMQVKYTKHIGKEARFIMCWDVRPKSEVYAWWVRRRGRRGSKRRCRSGLKTKTREARRGS